MRLRLRFGFRFRFKFYYYCPVPEFGVVNVKKDAGAVAESTPADQL